MTTPSPELLSAQIEAIAARARLNATFELVQLRLEPKRLARETAQGVSDAGNVAARRTVEVVRSNPATVAGAIVVAGLLLGRHRIARLLRRKR